MEAFEHPEKRCRCGHRLWYGLKEEPSGWKVYAICLSEKGCGREQRVGWIPRRSVDHLDDLYREAESML